MICARHCYVHSLFRVILFSPPKCLIRYRRNKAIHVAPLFKKRNCKIRNVDFCFIKMRNSEGQKYFPYPGTEASSH